ncbi:hypothetical protein [Kordia sp.]|uniref:hypothetical protein n=1 Tax=Kordia sp. TaxID=1965332 RepID=UPI003867B17E
MFPGTWEWENDNQIFRVHLWINTKGATKGHFEMVQVNTNGEETIIYRSDKPMNSATPQHWLPVISGGRQSEKYFMARIMDNSMNYEAPEYQQYEFWQARLDMKIIQIGNTEGIPTKATWKVGYYDITPNNAMPLNIPTDIVLTKVN